MKSATTWLVANWKMNGAAEHAREYAYAVNAALSALPAQVVGVFCPPIPYIAAALEALPYNARLHLGAQNCHAAVKGAHTGEVSAGMLKDVGCRYVIIGHSERRAEGETDEQVLAKAEAALAQGLTPIICIGESLAAYEKGETKTVLDIQLKPLARLPLRDILIAYEPIWAIGTGKTPSLQEISATHSHIKSVLGSEAAVLYGGSVNTGNARDILRLPEVSGALIGGASLQSASMNEILSAALESARA